MRHPSRVSRTVFILVGFALVAGACHNYYKVNTSQPTATAETAHRFDSLQKDNRYFILRNGDQPFAITKAVINAEQTALTCELQPLPLFHTLHLQGGIKRNMQYRKNDPNSRYVLSEVHFYTQPDTSAKVGKYTLPLDKVFRIEVIEHDRKRTTNSYVIGALGYTAGAAVLVGIIIAATKSSCPFVSAYKDGEFVLQGEIYGGAIYPQLARHDYMPLKMSPAKDGSLQVKISNELRERQYTDLAELSVITHDTSTKVWTDQQGKFYAVANPQSPVSAMLNENKTVTDALLQQDDSRMLYMDDSSAVDASNEIVLRFRKPADSKNGKLLLTLKNSYWLDYLYGELAKGFGTYYAAYNKEQKTKPAAELMKWTNEQQIPLRVSLRDGSEWKDVTSITTIGPLATRELLVPLTLSESRDETIEIKLSSGFMFWEIDYAAIDFTNDQQLDVQSLDPQKAVDEKGNNVLAVLSKDDGAFLDQPEIGNTATIIFKPLPLKDPGKTRTCILHTKGYYEHIREFDHKPDLPFLAQFRKPNAFPVYGMKLFQQLKNNKFQLLASEPHQKNQRP